MNKSIEIQSLKFGYARGEDVIDIESLSVSCGERIFLHGPSGCGKTTLLGLLSGILASSHGSIKILGNDLGAMPPAERDRFRGDHFGYVFQMFNLLPYLNVMDNITLPLRFSQSRLSKVSGTPESEALVLAQALGIGNLMKRQVMELSVGQQQRVAAARALIGKPEILICDEPTSALDHLHRDRFLDLLIDVVGTSKTTLIFVSHDRSVANRFERSVDLAALNREFRASTGDD